MDNNSVPRELLDVYIKLACDKLNQKVNDKLSNEVKYRHIYASDIVNTAYNEIGYFEKDEIRFLDNPLTPQGTHNYTKYARDIKENFPEFYSENVQGRRWSSTFIDWIFLKFCGERDARRLLCRPDINNKNNRESSITNYTYNIKDVDKYKACFAYEKSYNAFKNANRLIDNPQFGALVYFKNKDDLFDHIGIIYKYDSRNIYTIEGDLGDCVAKGIYKLDDSTIYAYAMPDYDNNIDDDMINIHVSPRRSNWILTNPDFPNDPEVRTNTYTIVTPPIPNPTWDVSVSSGDGSGEHGSGKLLTPTIEEIMNACIILVISGNDEAKMSVRLEANLTKGIFSNGGYNPYPDDEAFNWAKEPAFYPKGSRIYLIPPDTTAEIHLSNSTYNFRLYNKIALQSLVGPIQIYDRYENMEMDLSDIDNCSRLKEFNLFNSLIHGEIFHLANAYNLHIIDLNHTNIHGDLSNITSLKYLSSLMLYNTSIYGDIANLDKIPSLEVFNLNSTGLYGDIDGIKSLHKLSRFDFNDTYVYGNLSSLSGLTNLVEIWINCDSTVGIIGDIANLSGLYNLGRIHLRGKDIYGDIGSIGNLPLNKVHFSNAKISGNLSNLFSGMNYKSFNEIEFNNCEFLSGNTKNIIITKNNMNHIYLHNTNVLCDIDDLSLLDKLIELKIDKTTCNGNLSSLYNCTKLQWLDLSNSNISGDISNLRNMNQLLFLNLDNLKNIIGSIDNINTRSMLTCRICNCNKIKGNIGNINGKNIKILWFYNNNISGDIADLKNIDYLKDLRIYNTNVYGNIISLKTLFNLNMIILFSSKIRGNINNLKKYLLNLIYIEKGDQYTNSKWV